MYTNNSNHSDRGLLTPSGLAPLTDTKLALQPSGLSGYSRVLEPGKLYSDLLAKEKIIKKDHAGSIYFGNCKVAIPKELLIEIFEMLSSKDILSFSCANRPSFLLTNNKNEKFWNEYANGIIHLNFNPSKSIFTSMINTGENEMCEILKNEISKLQPFQRYIFQASFISPISVNGKKTLLDRAVGIEVGQLAHEKLNSKEWIFRKEFMPSNLYLEIYSDPFDLNFQTTYSTPSNIVYFNIDNIPSFFTPPRPNIDEDKEYQELLSGGLKFGVKKLFDVEIKGLEEFKEFEEFSQEALKILMKKTTNFEVKLKNDFETVEEYSAYLISEREAVQNSGLHEIFNRFNDVEKIYEIALEYSETLPEDKKIELLKLLDDSKNHNATFEKKKLIKTEMELKETSPQHLDLLESLAKRVSKISSPNYIFDGKPGTDMTPEEHKPLTFSKKCKNWYKLIGEEVLKPGLVIGLTALTGYVAGKALVLLSVTPSYHNGMWR